MSTALGWDVLRAPGCEHRPCLWPPSATGESAGGFGGGPTSPSRLAPAHRGLRPERGVLSLHSWLPEKPQEGFAGTQPPLSVLSLLAGMSCLDRAVMLGYAVAGPRRSWGVRRHLNVAQGAAGLGGGAEGTTSSCSHSGLYLTRPQAGLGWTGVQQESARRAVAPWVVGGRPLP